MVCCYALSMPNMRKPSIDGQNRSFSSRRWMMAEHLVDNRPMACRDLRSPRILSIWSGLIGCHDRGFGEKSCFNNRSGAPDAAMRLSISTQTAKSSRVCAATIQGCSIEDCMPSLMTCDPWHTSCPMSPVTTGRFW